MRRVFVRSDGTPRGTEVLDEDGNALPDIKELWIRADPEGVVVELTSVLPVLSIHAAVEGVTMNCPVCGDSVNHKCPPPE